MTKNQRDIGLDDTLVDSCIELDEQDIEFVENSGVLPESSGSTLFIGAVATLGLYACIVVMVVLFI